MIFFIINTVESFKNRAQYFNLKYALENLLRPPIASKSDVSLHFLPIAIGIQSA